MINGVTEQAILEVLPPVLPLGLPIYVTDEEQEKTYNAPCLLIRAVENENVIDPTSGIFKVTVQLTLRLHPNSPGKEFAAETTRAIDEFAFGTTPPPAERLSQVDNFHCYGFMPFTGTVGIDPERKLYEYVTQWQLWCMPRNNS